MPNNPRRANGAQRTKLLNRLRSENRRCWICVAFGRSGRIDYGLPQGHPYCFECDEIVPVSKYWLGGYPTPEACALDYNNLAAAHRCCNLWRGNKTYNEVMRIAKGRAGGTKPPTKRVTSRDWRHPDKEVDDGGRQEGRHVESN